MCMSELEFALRLSDAFSSWFIAKIFWHVLEEEFGVPHLLSSFRAVVYCWGEPEVVYTLISYAGKEIL